MKKCPILIALLLLPVLPALAGDEAQDLLASVIAEAKAQRIADRYAYSRTLVVKAEDEAVNRTERYDPTRPEGKRWTLVAVEGNPPGEQDMKDYEAEVDSDNPIELYSDVVGDLEANKARLVEETDGHAVYDISGSVAGLLDEDQADFEKYLRGRLTIDKSGATPYVSELRVYAPEAFKPMIGARIDRFEIGFHYKRDGERGHVLPTGMVVDVAVEALVFFSVEALTEIRFDDYVWSGEEI